MHFAPLAEARSIKTARSEQNAETSLTDIKTAEQSSAVSLDTGIRVTYNYNNITCCLGFFLSSVIAGCG